MICVTNSCGPFKRCNTATLNGRELEVLVAVKLNGVPDCSRKVCKI